MSTDALWRHVIVGTAGHIDHGKTRLVRRLTGIDTDRLPEEKARGISIDLGFAHFEAEGVRFGVIDVPGHEKFIRNMVAGATGIDLALLVVAADDGLMPQTIEHLEILDLLGVSSGVVAITKTDAVDRELITQVSSELAERLRGTFLEGSPIVPVSSVTGEGIERLTSVLVSAAATLRRHAATDLFRMPVDRVFSVAGQGTVVTGSVIGGTVRASDTLELLPAQQLVRVRGLQNHGRPIEHSGAGNRTAVNLAGVKVADLKRGDELATPGFLQPSQRLLVRLTSLRSSPITLRDRMRLTLHLGTGEVEARLALKGRTLVAGDEAFAELRTLKPVVASWGQRFIIRRPSPTVTVAGGMVLDPGVEPRRRLADLAVRGAALSNADELERLSHHFSECDQVDPIPLKAAWKAGIAPDRYPKLIERLVLQKRLMRMQPADPSKLVHVDRMQAIEAAVLHRIHAEVLRHRPRRALPRSALLSACRRLASGELVRAAFDRLLSTGAIAAVGSNFGPADLQVQLTKIQATTRRRILALIAAGRLAPPTMKDLAGTLGQEPEAIVALLELCVEEMLLIELEKGMYFAPAALERARAICQKLLAAQSTVTISQLREAWRTSRRYAFPLCQYLDDRGITIRDGDVRRAGPRLAMPLGPKNP